MQYLTSERIVRTTLNTRVIREYYIINSNIRHAQQK